MSTRTSLFHSPVVAVFIFFVALSCALGYSRLSNSQTDGEGVAKPLKVEIMGAGYTSAAPDSPESYVGRVEAGQRTQMGFDISGVITAVYKSEGESFEKGEVLATLDTKRLRARQNELAARMTRAKSAKKLAESSLKRAEGLKKTGNISEQALDESRQRRDTAEAEFELVRAQQASIRVELQKSRLYAPFDGIVIDRLTDEGRATVPSAPVLQLEELGNTEIRVGLPLNRARKLVVGQTVNIQHGSDVMTAKVERINLALSDARVSEVYLVPSTPNESLISGELVSVQLDRQQASSGVWVPIKALSEYGRGLWSIYLAKPNAESDFAQVTRTIVEIVQFKGELAQVSGGLTAKDAPFVVVGATHRVVAGQQVSTFTETEQVVSPSQPVGEASNTDAES